MSLPPRRPPRHSLPQITPEAVTKALNGIDVSFCPGRQADWLAHVVKRAMEYSVLDTEYSPMRLSNAEARQELTRMADAVDAALDALRGCDRVIELQLASYASMTATGDGPTSWGKMLRVIDELGPLSTFLREVVRDFETQRGPWRQSEEKYWRTERATALALIYEAAFGVTPTANNFPSDARHKRPTPFMEFCGRMLTLAFGAHETTNLAEVAKEACRSHRLHPKQFAEYVIGGEESH